jgi:hypothetical protein
MRSIVLGMSRSRARPLLTRLLHPHATARWTSDHYSPYLVRLITIATPSKFLSARKDWPVHTSCRWRDWKTVPGLIPRGFPLVADGVVTAPLPATTVKFHRKTCWKHFATWATPAVATGRLRSVAGTQCDSPFRRRVIPRCQASRAMPVLLRPASCSSVMFVNEITSPSNMAILSSTYRKRPGCGGTAMPAFRRWPNVSWSRT